MNRAALRAALAAVLALALAACANGPPPLPTGPPIPGGGTPLVYAALGASETAGTGLNDSALQVRYAWPQLFYNDALPRASTYYNFAVPGITTTEALDAELLQAVAVHPDVVTVFFNIDDLVNGTTPATFGANLQRIVHAMRQGGRAKVMVANAPSVDNLPALLACRGLATSDAKCPLPPGVTLPPQGVVDAEVDAYNSAIASVVAREGASLVDLHAHSDLLVSNPEDVAADGLHPSPKGNQLLAQFFTAVYRAQP